MRIGETKNLAETEPERTAELAKVLERWRAEIDAPVPTEPNPQYDAAAEAAAIEKAKAGKRRAKSK